MLHTTFVALQTELFQMEVTEAIAPGYRDHVFFPMDLGTIKKVRSSLLSILYDFIIC